MNSSTTPPAGDGLLLCDAADLPERGARAGPDAELADRLVATEGRGDAGEDDLPGGDARHERDGVDVVDLPGRAERGEDGGEVRGGLLRQPVPLGERGTAIGGHDPDDQRVCVEGGQGTVIEGEETHPGRLSRGARRRPALGPRARPFRGWGLRSSGRSYAVAGSDAAYRLVRRGLPKVIPRPTAW